MYIYTQKGRPKKWEKILARQLVGRKKKRAKGNKVRCKCNIKKKEQMREEVDFLKVPQRRKKGGVFVFFLSCKNKLVTISFALTDLVDNLCSSLKHLFPCGSQ